MSGYLADRLLLNIKTNKEKKITFGALQATSSKEHKGHGQSAVKNNAAVTLESVWISQRVGKSEKNKELIALVKSTTAERAQHGDLGEAGMVCEEREEFLKDNSNLTTFIFPCLKEWLDMLENVLPCWELDEKIDTIFIYLSGSLEPGGESLSLANILP